MRTAGESFFESEGDRLDYPVKTPRRSETVTALEPRRSISVANHRFDNARRLLDPPLPSMATKAMAAVSDRGYKCCRLIPGRLHSVDILAETKFRFGAFFDKLRRLVLRPLSSVAITKQLKMVSARRRKSEPDRRTRDPPLPSFGVAEDGRATHSHKPSHPS